MINLFEELKYAKEDEIVEGVPPVAAIVIVIILLHG